MPDLRPPIRFRSQKTNDDLHLPAHNLQRVSVGYFQERVDLFEVPLLQDRHQAGPGRRIQTSGTDQAHGLDFQEGGQYDPEGAVGGEEE